MQSDETDCFPSAYGSNFPTPQPQAPRVAGQTDLDGECLLRRGRFGENAAKNAVSRDVERATEIRLPVEELVEEDIERLATSATTIRHDATLAGNFDAPEIFRARR
ncbi:MAG TPA: hypothetical protein VH142_07335 [Polyangiaceae bacterium]|nr:hypothetical protein [Polyangiaceae bacterium]